MAQGLNKALIIGNLGKDPEVRTTQNGGKIVSMTIATSESWVDRASGERKEKTEWHRVVIFNEKLGEIAERYLKKGSRVFLEGQIVTRKYTDSSGVEKYTTEIVLNQFRSELVLLDKAEGGEERAPTGSRGGAQVHRGAAAKQREDFDEIPF